MTKKVIATWYCDNPACGNHTVCGHGLPKGWYSVAYSTGGSRTVLGHYCCWGCVQAINHQEEE